MTLFFAAMLALAACERGEAPFPEKHACLLGGYEMAGGRVMGLTPRTGADMRYTFISGETGAVALGEDGVWRGETASGDAATITAEDCGAGGIVLARGDEELSGQRLAFQVTETRYQGVDGERAGRLVLPADGRASHIVISVHGSERWSGRTGERLQTLLPAFGIGVFAYDKRGTGESEGKYTQDFHILAGDAARALEEARRLYKGDAKFGYWGGSQGGWVAPLAALEHGADFVIAAYGMAEGPLAEDREEVFTNLRDAGWGEDVLEKAREITDATGAVMASNFKEGFDELSRVRKKYKDEPWYKDIKGEYSGDFLKAPNIGLRIAGPFMDQGTSWDYEPRPALEALTMPHLWILAGEDREAPSATTLAILRQIQETRPNLDIAVFPGTDHGIRTFTVDETGTRVYGDYARGYYALIRNWILTGEPALGAGEPVVYRGARPAAGAD